MKNLYTLLLLLVLGTTAGFAQTRDHHLSASQQAAALGVQPAVKKLVPGTQMSAYDLLSAQQRATRAVIGYIEFPHFFNGYYDQSNEEYTNYYIVVSTSEGSFDTNTGSLQLNEPGMIMAIDMYAPGDAAALPTGTYMPNADEEVPEGYSYNYNYTTVLICNKLEEGIAGGFPLDRPITVLKNLDGTYHISVEVQYDEQGNTVELVYNGELPLQGTSSSSSHFMPQIGADVVRDYTKCTAYYQGNLFKENTGNFLLSLYDGEYDEETGAMTGSGYNLQVCLFNKLFPNSKDAKLIGGTYEMQRNFRINTFYPGIELNFMGQIGVMGTFVEYRDGSGQIYYSYATGGTVKIFENADGTITVVADLTTDEGFVIKGTYTGEYNVVDMSDDRPDVHVSTLTEDVELDLDEIPTAHIYRMEDINECGRYFVQIGTSEDKAFDHEHEGYGTLSFELLTEPDVEALPNGTYTCMEYVYSNYYKPFCIVPGYFNRDATGAMEGSQYIVYYTRAGVSGKIYMYLKDHAPIYYGTVNVSRQPEGTMTFKVLVQDDAYYNITGTWTGVAQGDTWDYNGIAPLEASRTKPYFHDGRVFLGSMQPECSVYTADGKMVRQAHNVSGISLEHLPAGIYVVRAGDANLKVCLK